MAMKSCAVSMKVFPAHRKVPFMPCSEGSAKRAAQSNMREKSLTAQHENTIALQKAEKQNERIYLENGTISGIPFQNWEWNSPCRFLLQ